MSGIGVVTRTDLILEMARNCETTQREAKTILEIVFDGMVRALRRGESVELRRFGVFYTRKRRPRTGRNPLTGAQVKVPERRIPFFKPSKELKAMLLQLPKPAIGPTGGGTAGRSKCQEGTNAPGPRTATNLLRTSVANVER